MSAHVSLFARFALAAVALVTGCAHERFDMRVDQCGAPETMDVSSVGDADGREVTVQRILPVAGNCEDIIVDRLRYDRAGALVGRAWEHQRCGVVERSITATRGEGGWLVERAHNVDHDEHMDEVARSFVPADELELSELTDPQIDCVLAPGK